MKSSIIIPLRDAYRYKLGYLLLLILLGNSSCQERISSLELCQKFDGLEGLKEIRCGTLAVPENHHDLSGKKTLQIAYVIIPAKEANLQNAPVIFLAGGPGNGSLTRGQVSNWLESDLRKDKDIILFDQRGIGESSPLPNMIDELSDIMGANSSVSQEEERMADLFQSYVEKTNGLEISLENYNTIQSAHDVGSLMKHLGYEQYNLYGVSYGTRLARAVQEKYPQFLNAVILNSPDPIKGDFLLNRLKSYSLALERVFIYCENDKDCGTTYPDLQEDYFQMVKTLISNPVRTHLGNKPFYINAQDGIYFIRRALYSTNSRTLVPALIEELSGWRRSNH